MSQLKLAFIVTIGAISSLTLWLLKIAFVLCVAYGVFEAGEFCIKSLTFHFK